MKNFRDICEDGVQSYAPEERNDYRADFSLNENPLGCSDKVLERIRQVKRGEISEYKPVEKSLVKKIANYENVSEENVVISAGSDKCLQTIANSLFTNDSKVSYTSPGFPRYDFYIRLRDAEPNPIEYRLFEERDSEKILRDSQDSGFLVVDNPSNPTGHRFSRDEMDKIIKEFEGYTIIDGALNDDRLKSKKYTRGDTFLTKSFSKYFGLPGLRIGYIITSRKNASKLRSITSPFEVSALAQEAAEAALEDKKHLQQTKEYVEKERKRLKDGLKILDIRHTDSNSTNMVIQVSESMQEELKKKGINLTEGSDYKGLPNNTARLGVRKKEENQILLEELRELR